MSGTGSPADKRAFILERLVGETGEPDQIVETARDLAARSAPAITSGLESLLSFVVPVSLASVSLSRMADAKPPEGAASTLCVVASEISPDAVVLLLDTAAIGLFTTAMFGGDPDIRSTPSGRDLTPIELDVATLVFGQVVEAVNGSGARSLKLHVPPPAAIAGVDIDALQLRDGPAVRIEFLATSSAGVGRIVMTMPQRLMLKPRGEGGAARTSGAGWGSRFGDEVIRSKVNLTATVPLARMTLGEIGRLVPGQIIELPSDAQSRTLLAAKDKSLFVCEFGRLGQNYTVRVRQPFDAAADLMDSVSGR